MPIKGVSGRVRAPRTCKIRLGYKKPGENFPRDSDVFVGYDKDGVTKAIIDAYGARPIAEAEGQAFSLGKALRMMLPWEFDETYRDREVGLELMNRAWAHSKLRCMGDGGEVAGDAVCRDKSMADEIAKATKRKAVARADGDSWDVVCLGPKCPFWNSNLETNKQATCHREMRLWAWLLHPDTDPESKNYNRKLAAAEIASGSWNGMLDVQSGFMSIRSLLPSRRTALIPFTLRRVPRTVLSGGKRVIKATLLVDFDQDEVIRFGYSDPQLALVRPEVRKQLLEQKEELLRLAAMESGHDTFRDIVPRLEGHRERPEPESQAPSATVSAADVVGDRDQVIDQAVGDAPAQLSEEELARFLTQDERNELKVLCGGIPGDVPSQGHFRDLCRQAFKELGGWEQAHGADDNPPLSLLRVKHQLWIRGAVEAERGAA